MAESTSPKFISRHGRLGWLSGGQFYPIGGISGGADDGGDSGDDGGDDDGGAGGDGGRTFTQDDLTRVGTREKREGKRAGQRELLEALGFNDVDEATEFVQSMKDRQDADKDELTREKEAAAKTRAEGEAAKTAAAQARHEANVLKGLLLAGADVKSADKLVRMVDAEVGAEADDIATAVESLKEEFPALFESESKDDDEDDDTGGGTPDSNPGKAGGKKPQGSAHDRAMARLRERHPNLAKSD